MAIIALLFIALAAAHEEVELLQIKFQQDISQKGCAAGQYPKEVGTDAEVGQDQVTTECTDCPAGKYGDLTGCQMCGADTHTSEAGMDACHSCDAKTMQQRGASACYDPPNNLMKFGDGKLKAIDDASDTFNDAAILRTTSYCTLGTYQDETAQDSCKKCPIGHYTHEHAADHCLECPLGKFQDQLQQSNCLSCPTGYMALTKTGSNALLADTIAAAGKCLGCIPGRYMDQEGDADGCKACPNGYVQKEANENFCNPCLKGTYMNSDTAIGTYGGVITCDMCPSGKYTDADGKDICREVQPGGYQDLEGQTEEKFCPPGTISEQTLALGCASCPAGFYQKAERKTACRSCPIGHYADGTGNTKCT